MKEAEVRTQVCRRRTCEECGELATRKHTYLLDGARSNLRSSAYGRDDCSWCSDADVFTCEDCKPSAPRGYESCSRFKYGERFEHLFLQWETVDA